ncbi:glycosyltransferase family 2 protein [Candidatus Poribacteria bacterium]|nr:glycosyltransferase family 2 protein [Candidatus Poribacteria bacterium]
MNKKKLSILILTYNCEDIIEKCLKSTLWADEVLIVDSYSTDHTLEICRKYVNNIIQHEYINYSSQNNWAIPQLKNEWVLIVDSDEVVTTALRASIESILQNNDEKYNGYYVHRKTHFLGKSINFCGERNDKDLRFFKKDKGKCEDKLVHSDITIEGEAGFIKKGYLEHYQQRNLKQYFEKFNRYTTWSAQEMHRKGKKANLFHFTIRPAFKFIQTFFLQFGFLDGLHGFFWCILASVYVFTKYLKLWELRNRQN